MPALRVDITAGTPEQDAFQLTLDCWKAELYIVQNPFSNPMAAINGRPLYALLMPQTNGTDATPMRFEFGGMYRKGRPVNINEVLNVTIPAIFFAAGVRVSYLLTRTYLDPDLDDPNTFPV